MLKNLGYIGLPILFVSLHWILVRIYAVVCVPDTFVGYINSYITVANPACVFVLTLLEKTSNLYLSGWVFLTMGSVSLLKHLYHTLTHPNMNRAVKKVDKRD